MLLSVVQHEILAGSIIVAHTKHRSIKFAVVSMRLQSEQRVQQLKHEMEEYRDKATGRPGIQVGLCDYLLVSSGQG